MKKQVMFIHGGDSFTKREDFLRYLTKVEIRNLPSNQTGGFWTKTLREDLGEEFEVFMPSMPNSQNAKYDEWKIWFERHYDYLKDGVILVGWSLGGMFLAKYLIENKPKVAIKALVLLAAPCGYFDDSEGNDCGTFQFDPQQLPEITKSVKNISIWHSEDDFVVPFEHVRSYEKYLPEAEIVLFSDKNHFLVPTLSELISKIKKT
jgi:predicted alpha/beta hydrolase family esterase